MDLKQHYDDYISAINAGCHVEALSNFVREGIVHNDSPPLSVEQYANAIADSQASFPGLDFHVEMIVVESDKDDKGQLGYGNVAVRIKLSYDHPELGRKEGFHEHVFYRFEGWKITRVWSLLDGAGQKWRDEKAAKAGN